MATITINNRQIEIIDLSLKFNNEKLGLDNSIKIKGIYIDLVSSTITGLVESKLILPTGIELDNDKQNNVKIKGDAVDLLISDALVHKIINLVFKEVMGEYGLQADQVYNDTTGEIEVKETIFEWKPDMKALKGQLFSYDGKNYRCQEDHVTVESQDPTKAKEYWVEEKTVLSK